MVTYAPKQKSKIDQNCQLSKYAEPDNFAQATTSNHWLTLMEKYTIVYIFILPVSSVISEHLQCAFLFWIFQGTLVVLQSPSGYYQVIHGDFSSQKVPGCLDTAYSM